jgi:hypothetical protein
MPCEAQSKTNIFHGIGVQRSIHGLFQCAQEKSWKDLVIILQTAIQMFDQSRFIIVFTDQYRPKRQSMSPFLCVE